MGATYTCAVCHGTFETGRSEEEARAELQVNFPGASVEDCEQICEDCYNKPGALDRARDDYQSRN